MPGTRLPTSPWVLETPTRRGQNRLQPPSPLEKIHRIQPPYADVASDSELPALPQAQTVFLLSPAHCGGKRAKILLDQRATFPLAVRLRESGAAIGDVFSFLSGLYFRGKLGYGRSFACLAAAPHGVLVITPGRGLIPP